MGDGFESHDLTDILDQRDRDYCMAALRSRWVAGIDVCGAGGRQFRDECGLIAL